MLDLLLAWAWLVSAPPELRGRPCPDDMVLVEGTHPEELQRLCTDVRKSKCWAFFPALMAHEARFTEIRTCMDRYEWPNRKGGRPEVMMTFVEAEKMCADAGKRMCTEFEWELACEGPEHLPWPCGWAQREGVCHNEKRYRHYRFDDLHSSDRRMRDRETARLWQGAPSGTHPGCTSAYGVDDLVGNVEEWVSTSRTAWPYRSSLKGGFWAKAWSGCRGTNESHSPQFRFYEIGFRCCADPE